MTTTTQDNQAVRLTYDELMAIDNTIDNQTNQTNTGDQSMNVTTHKDLEFDAMQGTVNTDKPIIIDIPSSEDQVKSDKKAAAAVKRADTIAKKQALKALENVSTPAPDIEKTSILEDQDILAKALKAKADRSKEVQLQVLSLDLREGITSGELTEYCIATNATRKLEQIKVGDQVYLVYLVGTVEDTELGKMFVEGSILYSTDQGDNYLAIGKIGNGKIVLDNEAKASKIQAKITSSVFSELDRQLAKRDQQNKTKLENLKNEQEKLNSLASKMKTRKPLV